MTELHPKKFFLIDGIGAILSAFLLGIVLVKFESVFGIPAVTLYVLASVPLLFAVYDFYSYQQSSGKFGSLLKGIAVMNMCYCCLSVGLAVYHFQEITVFGWMYIVVEVLLVVSLAILELIVAKKHLKSSST